MSADTHTHSFIPSYANEVMLSTPSFFFIFAPFFLSFSKCFYFLTPSHFLQVTAHVGLPVSLLVPSVSAVGRSVPGASRR